MNHSDSISNATATDWHVARVCVCVCVHLKDKQKSNLQSTVIKEPGRFMYLTLVIFKWQHKYSSLELWLDDGSVSA